MALADGTHHYPSGATATMVRGGDIDKALDAITEQRGGGIHQMNPRTHSLAEARGADVNRVLDQLAQDSLGAARKAAQNQAVDVLRNMGIPGTQQPDRAPQAPAQTQSTGPKPGHAAVDSQVARLATQIDLTGVKNAAQGQGTHAAAVAASKGTTRER